MTEKLFWKDAYIREFDSTVELVDGNRVILESTAFNPRGGGLVSDTGKINGVRMVEAAKEGDNVVHMLDGPADLRVGDRVHGELDWERRHRIMRMHTAAHMLSAVVNRETGALITGNQIAPEGSRVDFNLEAFDKEKMGYYVGKVNEAVLRGLTVRAYSMKREEVLATPGLVKLANAMPPSLEVLRIVEIGDVDTQADGGVHVKNTLEIGKVVVTGTENKGKNNRRMHFTVE